MYRNGIRIGMSPVSTGKPGYETPTGVFTILQKHREHYSNRYDNAPMPYMQRLTWDGIALHAGQLPGYPASHGCIRLPYAFSERLFGITARGMTVVVTASMARAPDTTSPGLFASPPLADARDPGSSTSPWSWHPERAPQGPINLLLSTRDKQIVVLRGGVEIGWARIDFRDAALHGTSVYTLLEGAQPGPSPVVAERPALKWLSVPVSGTPVPATDPVRAAVIAGRLVIPQAFARQVYDALTPGAMLVVTDEPLHGKGLVVPATLFEAQQPAQAPASPPRR